MKCLRYLVVIFIQSPAHAGDLEKNPTKEPVATEDQIPVRGHWRLSGGAVWRSFGDANWSSGPSYSAGFIIPSLVGSARLPGYRLVGPLGSYADRDYNDGFVRRGSITDQTGDTWNWGYSSTSQISGDSMSFHAPASPSSTLQSDQDSSATDWSSDNTDGAGPYVSLDYLFDLTPQLAVGPQISFMFAGFDTGNRSTSFRASQERRDYSNIVTDTYGLDGSIPPQAPYSGSYGGPGMLLRNNPDNRYFTPTQTGGEKINIWNNVRESLEVDLYTLSLGPQFEFHQGRFSARGGLGLALNIANIDAERTESLHASNGQVLQRWKETRSKTELLPGFYLSVEAGYALTQQWSVSVFGRHDWNKDISGKVGPSTFHVDMDAWTVGTGLNWRF